MNFPSRFRASLTLACALAPLACGARASLLDGDATSTGGAGGTTTSAGGAGGVGGVGGGVGGVGGVGGTGGTGGAGGADACNKLVWAGPPVLVPTAAVAGEPALLRTGIAAHVLVFDVKTPDVTLLQSAAVAPWWTVWPPVVGALGVAHTLNGNLGLHAPTRGEPGSFTYAHEDFQGMVLGAAKPGEPGNPAVSWAVTPTQPRALARDNGGAYLLASGPASGLVVDILPNLSSPPTTSFGQLACASEPVAAAAVGLGDHGFLVASTNDAPFDNCIDPVLPGPPTVVQILRFKAGSSTFEQGGFVEEAGPVRDVQLSGRIGGAWLTYRVEGNPLLHIRAVDEAGQLGEDWSVFGNALYGDAVAARDGWFAHATVFPGGPDAQSPFVNVYVRTGGGLVQIEQVAAADLHPVGRPAIAVSDDSRSILIAFRNDAGDGSQASIGLLRADCAP